MSELKVRNHSLGERVVSLEEAGSISLLNLGAFRRLVDECAGMVDGSAVYVSRTSPSGTYCDLHWVGRIEVRGAEESDV